MRHNTVKATCTFCGHSFDTQVSPITCPSCGNLVIIEPVPLPEPIIKYVKVYDSFLYVLAAFIVSGIGFYYIGYLIGLSLSIP